MFGPNPSMEGTQAFPWLSLPLKIIAFISPYDKGLWVQIHYHPLKGEEHSNYVWT